MKHTELDAPSVAKEAMLVASQICIYTNDEIVVEEIGS
jgi:ATP-dependent HslUV protease subunit HslV